MTINSSLTTSTTVSQTDKKEERHQAQFALELEEQAPSNKTHSKDERTNEEVIQDMQELIQNIKHIIRTGFTKDELDALKEEIDQIRKRLKEGELSPKEAEKLILEIEQNILILKRRTSANSTMKTNQEDVKASKELSTEALNNPTIELLNRLDESLEDIKELEKSRLSNSNGKRINNDELELLEMIKRNA